MKTPLIYAGIITFACVMLTLINHVLGFSTEPDKMMMGLVIGTIGVLTILITGIILGTKAARAGQAPTAGFTYGQAFKTGFLIILFAALMLSVFNYIYFSFIFPNFADVQIEWMRGFMEKMNAPAAKIDEALEQARAKATVSRQMISAFIFTVVLGTFISLITSAVMKRPPAEDFAAPPPIA